MKVLFLAIQLWSNSYYYETTEDKIIMFGHAINEASCTIDQSKDSPSCIAYCFANINWVDEENMLPVCKDIL